MLGIGNINLQLFAEEKTEKATAKKRQNARKKGQVLQSREITSSLLLMFLLITIKFYGSSIFYEISNFFGHVVKEYPNLEQDLTLDAVSKLFVEGLVVFLKITWPIFAVGVIISCVVSYAQVGFLFTTETLGLKFSKINPLNGLKRLFSLHSVVELLKAILKVIIVSFIAYSYIKGEETSLLSLMAMDVRSIAIYICNTTLNVAIRICFALVVLGVLDYWYQWWEYEKSLRMSKQEVKEEYKQVEGNPEVKSKIKQKQRQMSMRRIMQDVPKADVVIANPTHFAVAVKYDQKKADAPYVIAKGQDYIALRIKDVARENNVEIVENKPLARTLYDTVEIGQAIPPELYQAVAEVLAFVYNLKEKGRAG